MQTPKAPAAPDPAATAAAQSGMNRDTARAQQMTNMTNQITPDGSLTYTRGGENSYVDSTGKTVTIPQFTATQALSAPNQKIYDTNKQTETNIAQIGRDQSTRISDLLGQPLNLNNEATEARLMELGRKRLDPLFASQEENTRSRLANQGVRAGTAAWDNEMNQFGQNRNDAYNQLALTGRGQAVQEALTERNQPINEITALMSGSQVNMPQQLNTPQAQVAGVDYSGMVRDKYNAEMQQYNNKISSNNAMMGGLLSTVGSLGGMGIYKYSDARVKEDIERVGELDNGLGVYSYRYKGSDTPEIGLIAQEVAQKNPGAVAKMGGILAVNYGEAVR